MNPAKIKANIAFVTLLHLARTNLFIRRLSPKVAKERRTNSIASLIFNSLIQLAIKRKEQIKKYVYNQKRRYVAKTKDK